ncbi:MAG TPA: response regulator transcription factor [Gaiellaceae bacterium]|nr:response regulator transcription factor [Gaiellaceae bacterium]
MRVIVIEDSGLLRDALGRLLADFDVEVAETLPTGDALVRAYREHRPDVCVVDVRLPPTFTDEGVRAAAGLREKHPEARVLLLSQAVEERYARELLAQRSEGLGYLLKDRVADGAEFVEALHRVAADGTALDPEVVRQLLVRRRAIDDLSPRERQVLELMAEGRSNAAIARRLVVTERAVEKHVANIFGKLRLPPSGDDHRRVLAVLAWLRDT